MRVCSSLPILSTIVLTVSLSHAHSQGLTLDDCDRATDCVSPRQCIDIASEELCRGSLFSRCVCIPPTPISCLSDDICPTGEVCAARSGGRFICTSESVVDNDSRFSRVTQPNPVRGGLTLDRCLRNSDCLAPRICVTQSNSGACAGSSLSTCFCVPPVLTACDADSDCPPGEACGASGVDICVSEGTSSGNPVNFPNPTGVADPENVQNALDGSQPPSEPQMITQTICIAERHMNGMKGIYGSGPHARVLCDTYGSCATPGHHVVFQGRGMLMKRYCALVGCVQNVMKVNSPTWERGLRLRSWSDGLEFTAFAARYETLVEELLLNGLVRAGL